MWWTSAVVFLILAATVGISEWKGWPMLRRPAERWASQKLDRQVSFEGNSGRWRLHLLGDVRIEVERIEIAAPSWSTLGSTLVASDAKLRLRWHDLYLLWRGHPLTVRSLEADTLVLRAQRLSDGRASWQLGRPNTQASHENVRFEEVLVRKGTAIVDDQTHALSMVAGFALRDGSAAIDGAGMHAEAEGRYRNLPMTATLRSGSALPWLSSDPKALAVPVDFHVKVGDAALNFEGQVRDLLASQSLSGHYRLSGPSLAAVGQALGLTLPTTPPFAMQGDLTRQGTHWTTAVKQATIGRSQLMGDFSYDRPAHAKPKLAGELRGPVLWLADLGPAIGASAPGAPAAPRPNGRVLPDRKFDLPSLSAMDADVKVHLDRLESGSAQLQAIEPMNARVVLQDGVLLIEQIDARLAQGRLAGSIRLDGRGPEALLDTKLSLSGMVLEQWLLAERKQKTEKPGKTPTVTGRVGGQLALKGRGRSTAELLASADGHVVLLWTHGTISHLLVEEAGLDIAQSLGVWLKGDEPLAVTCAVADMQVKQGMATPTLFVIDTSDSALRLDGSVSLATERLGLVMRVQPKDFSPMALRTPIQIGGSFGKPNVSVEKGPLLRKIVPSIALATINPLAGLLPLIDVGSSDKQSVMQDCQRAVERVAPQLANKPSNASNSSAPAPNPPSTPSSAPTP